MLPDTLEAKVQWLVDRAQISDLLFSFARALDTRDDDAYVANFAPGGILQLADPKGGEPIVVPRERMKEMIAGSLGRYRATHHLSTNHQIEVSGDTALSRSYLAAAHVREVPTDHWSGGGWYDCTYVRTDAGWRFTRVTLKVVWISGQPDAMRPPAPSPADPG